VKRWIAVALLAAAAPASDFRFSRVVEAPAGWCALELSDDVLDACRPGLPDLRLRDASGEDVPYAYAREDGQLRREELRDVESIRKRETTALLDRGSAPPLARAVTVEIGGEDFLKPVTIESSSDGASFREFAHGSLFATSRARSTTLHFSPNDRRYWRFRFDDRNSDPVTVTGVRVQAASWEQPVREIPLSVDLTRSQRSLLVAARLPAANLGVTTLILTIGEPAFQRRARVFERVFFRDGVSRRLLGEATLERSPDSKGSTEIPICDPASRSLEIEIENDDSPPLHVSGLTAIARAPRLLFFSERPGPLRLVYGSPAAAAPHYDLTEALRKGVPKKIETAVLGEPRAAGSPASVSVPLRGASLEVAAWTTRQPIEVPAAGEVAYLDLREPLSRQLSSLRIVDRDGRPVPHIVDGSVRETVSAVRPRVAQSGTQTNVTVSRLDPAQPPDALTLFASSPDYFSRDVTVVAPTRNGRSSSGDRVLGSSHWQRLPGEPSRPVTIALASSDSGWLRAEIENGDNAPLTIDKAEIQVPFVRIDFVFQPGEKLSLLSDNPLAPPPRYDLAMVADRVLASPAHPARLGLAEQRKGTMVPRWFWAAVVAAAILVGVALVRTLRTVEGQGTPPPNAG
jgi:hypothetical protein